MQFCSIQDPGYVKRRQVQQENFMEHNNNNNNNNITNNRNTAHVECKRKVIPVITGAI